MGAMAVLATEAQAVRIRSQWMVRWVPLNNRGNYCLSALADFEPTLRSIIVIRTGIDQAVLVVGMRMKSFSSAESNANCRIFIPGS